ncbi:hypothetical protein [Paenibacillus cellulositrophicus]|uniref:hypothetical protein n=1 Tax=Paenibacillus cellulositrophicus TaxID=562959 RepID=UPI003D985443
MREPILSVMKLKNDEFLIEIAAHFFERTDERSEDSDIGLIKNTLEDLASERFEFGMYAEEIVVRDFTKNISLVIVNYKVTEDDINSCPPAEKFTFKTILVTFYDHAEHFKQLNCTKVILIHGGNINEMEYKDYVEWFKKTYSRNPKETQR